MKNVIHIFGASGSGTTTLGRKICNELGFRHMDTDDYFWMPTDPKFTVKRPKEERIRLMEKDIAENENVVITGSLVDWGDILIPHFTLAVRISMEQDLRIERLVNRERERFGARIEPGGDMYEQHIEFVRWARQYDTGGTDMRSRSRHDEWQKLLKCKLLLIDGADTVENNYIKVRDHIGKSL